MKKKASINGILPIPNEPLTGNFVTEIKQKLLLFDGIGISHPIKAINLLYDKGEKQAHMDLKRLVYEGIVFSSVDFNLADEDNNPVDDIDEFRLHIRQSWRDYIDKHPDAKEEFGAMAKLLIKKGRK